MGRQLFDLRHASLMVRAVRLLGANVQEARGMGKARSGG